MFTLSKFQTLKKYPHVMRIPVVCFLRKQHVEERFMCYIEGESFEKSRNHPPCRDTTPPVAVRAVELPYDMYFANFSGSWESKVVSFIDVTKSGKALGVAYLITREQFENVVSRENCRRPQYREF